MPKRPSASIVVIGLLFAACGGSSSDAGTPSTAAILFPTAMSTSELALVTVRGTASNAGAVRVNGIAATSSDGFATWQAVVPLNHGANTLRVDARNPQGAWTEAAATATIMGRQHAFTYVGPMAFDATSQNLWILDDDRQAIIRVNLGTGERALLSGDGVPDDVNPLRTVRGIAYDALRDRLVVQSSDSLYVVSTTTGARTVLSSSTVPDNTNAWDSAGFVIVDTVNDRYLVSRFRTPSVIYTVDPTTGARTILSSNTVPDAVNPITDIQGMALDATRNRVLYASNDGDQVVAADLTTGARTVLSSATVPDASSPFESPNSVALDPAGGRLLLVERADGTGPSIVTVDLITGARTTLTEQEDGKGHHLESMQGLAVDATNGRAIVILDDTSEILAVDLTTGVRTEVASIHTPTAPEAPFTPTGIARDPETGDLYVADYGPGALYRIDPDTGVRTLLSGPGVPNDAAPLDNPYDVALDKDRNRALVCCVGQDEIIAVDLTTGARTLFAGPSGQNPISSPYAIVIDVARNRALVGDTSFRGITAFDLDTGAGSIFSDPTTPDTVAPLEDPTALVLDLPRDRLLVGDNNDSVYAVDLTTGSRTRLVDGQLGEPWGSMVYDETTDTLFIADYDYYGVIAADLTTGTVDGEWGTYDGLYYANNAWEPYGIAHDPVRGLFFVPDYVAGSIVVIDTVTRERVYLSR